MFGLGYRAVPAILYKKKVTSPLPHKKPLLSFLDSSGSFVLISDFLLVCTAVSLQNNENILLFCIVPPRISGAAARDRGASWGLRRKDCQLDTPCAASPD